jgi:hypothetical protein
MIVYSRKPGNSSNCLKKFIGLIVIPSQSFNVLINGVVFQLLIRLKFQGVFAYLSVTNLMLSLLNSKIRVDSLSLVWAKSSDSRNC